jgi:hypothetical protein
MRTPLAAILLTVLPAIGQPARISSDPRIELLSIVFHLAGNPEYNQCRVPAYCDAIDRYFEPFQNHDAIRMARELREKSGISYDAVMSMAIHLKSVDTLAEQVPFDSPESRLDQRWMPADARRFVAALRQFVVQAKFREFVEAHRDLYETTGARLRSLVESKSDLAWFDKFFGAKPGARFIVVPGLVNGGGNYGPSLRAEDGREEVYAIMGVWQVDAEKQPMFDARNLPTLVHEFAHSYVNPLVDSFAALDKAGDTVYRPVRSQMESQAYGNGHTLVCESLVRASTARYILAHDGGAAARQVIGQEEGRSFLWTGELFDLLGTYEAEREQFATLQTLMPRVVAYFEALAPRIGSMVQAYDAKRPKVVSMSPGNGTRDVDPEITKVVVKFDRSLRGGFSFCYAANKDLYPKFGKPVYDETRTTLSIDVQFEPGHDYEFRMNCAPGFVSEEGIAMKEVLVKWHTRSAR